MKKIKKELSTEQLQVLQFKALGFGEEKIAEIMGLKPRRVETLAKGIRIKLGTSNFPASVVKALERGLLVNDKNHVIPELSSQEISLIRIIAEGTPYKQIPYKLKNLSLTTVSRLVDSLKKRYKVKNVCQLIYVTHNLVRRT